MSDVGQFREVCYEIDLLCLSPNYTFKEAGTKLGPDQLGSLDPSRINPDQPGSTRIDLNLNTIKEKGCLIKETGYFYAFMD